MRSRRHCCCSFSLYVVVIVVIDAVVVVVYLVVLFMVHCLFMPVSQVIHFDTITLGVDVATVGDRLTCRRPHLYVSERERESEEWAREGRERAGLAGDGDEGDKTETNSLSFNYRKRLSENRVPTSDTWSHICRRQDYRRYIGRGIQSSLKFGNTVFIFLKMFQMIYSLLRIIGDLDCDLNFLAIHLNRNVIASAVGRQPTETNRSFIGCHARCQCHRLIGLCQLPGPMTNAGQRNNT